MAQYQEKAYEKVGPIWRSEVEKSVKKLARRGLKPMDIKPSENEVLLGLSIARDGAITDVRPITKSRFTFLNKAASQALLQASPLAPPPASCFTTEKEDCKLKWSFIVNTSR